MDNEEILLLLISIINAGVLTFFGVVIHLYARKTNGATAKAFYQMVLKSRGL